MDLLILGDNLVILPDQVLTDERMDHLNLEPRRRYRERLAAGTGYDDEHRTILQPGRFLPPTDGPAARPGLRGGMVGAGFARSGILSE